jgi:hypothetical protein
VVVTSGVTFLVPETAVDKTALPSVKFTLVAPVVDQVRSKLEPAPTAAVKVQAEVGGSECGGASVMALVHVPPAPIAVSV